MKIEIDEEFITWLKMEYKAMFPNSDGMPEEEIKSAVNAILVEHQESWEKLRREGYK